MNLLTRNEVQTLVNSNPDHDLFVSIFMPIYGVGLDTDEDKIRFKNLITEAEKRLRDEGQLQSGRKDLLEPAKALLDDDHFWQNQRTGLAVFVSPALFRTYHLPFECETDLIVGQSFYLKPLLPMFALEQDFYLLALSQNEVRFFRGAWNGLEQIALENVPGSLAEALRYDEPAKQQQFHTAAAPSGSGKQPAIFHGHGAGTDGEKNDILRYFQQIDRGVSEFLQGGQEPLLLAGVEYLFPIYQQANTYPHLSEDGIKGNPEPLSPAELHARAWPLVKQLFEQDRRQAAQRFEQLAHTDQVSNDLATIIPAAHYGQVEALFVAKNQHQWG
ncbi:MAG: hypothetical protein R3264_08585, partial [Anaerolineae bacterium]|nr:hypothetical protein [Anaerolineae bacterium]